MPHQDWEDLSAFFDPDEFATIAVITRGDETVAEVLGIFDDPNQVSKAGEYDLDHLAPRFTCSASDVSSALKDDVVSIEGKQFDLLEDPEFDGTGLATLLLAEPNVIYDAAI